MNADLPEAVYSVTDYYDGIRSGIASYHGTPHIFESQFENIEGGSESFLLRPIDAETFRLSLEEWSIWFRWEHAFHAGLAPEGSHPALPADRKRYTELSQVLLSRLTPMPDRARRVRGRFEVSRSGIPRVTSSTQFVVYWTTYDDTCNAEQSL